MKSFKRLMISSLCVAVLSLSLLTTGCATSGKIKQLQDQMNVVSDKADQAMAAAKNATASNQDCCADSKKAAAAADQSADRAEAAAVRSENAADKAEAIFMKKMIKK